MIGVRLFVLLCCGLLVGAGLGAGAGGCSDDDGGTNDNQGLDAGVGDAGPSPDAGPRTDATVPPVDPEWPVGIPRPDFGVDETVLSVHGDADYFTYYVDNTVACDDGGPGTVATPRCTLPSGIVAGDVVLIAAGTYPRENFWLDVTGTAAQPIFIRGPEAGPRPVITYDDSGGPGGLGFDLRANYLIVENLEFDKTRFLMEPGSTHVVLRYCDIHDHPSRSGVSARGDDLVIYQNEIHHFQGDPRLGVAGSCGVSRIWVIGNHIHHNAEDSVQFGHGCDGDRPEYLYIGGNVMHGDRENAVDFKWVDHVIVSQNRMYGYRPAPTNAEFCYDDNSGCYPAGYYSSGSDGSAMVIGSDGESRNVWVLLNEIYDSQSGIRNEESDGAWVFGNVIHDIVGAAIILEKRATGLHLVNNTFWGADVGIDQYQDEIVLTVANNLFANLATRAINIDSDTLAGAATLHSNLFWNQGNPVELRWSTVHSLQSDQDFAAITLGTVVGNLIADPDLVDPGQGDLHVNAGSSAIDAGDAGLADAVCAEFVATYGLDICVDLDRQPRPQGGGWDVGAFEQ
jgi:parallel beta helix pectate lyase-like protein